MRNDYDFDTSIVVYHKEKDKSGNSGESAWFSVLSNDH